MRLLVDGQQLDFDPKKMLNVEVMAITNTTGITFNDFGAQLNAMNYELITAIVWVLRKRAEPTLRFSDVVFEIGACTFEDDEEPGPKETQGPETTSPTDPSSPISSDSTPGTSTG